MKKWIVLSILIAIFVTAASLLGILNPNTYSQETTNWAMQAVGQDIGNLLAVVIFLISLYFVNKKSIKAFFVWLGTILYFIYAYLIYALFVHFNYLFIVYVTILGLSFYTLIGGLLVQKIHDIAKPLVNKNVKDASIVLIVIGALFTFLWLSEIITALLSGQSPQSVVISGLWVNPIHVLDLAIALPGMILTGILLWNKKLWGYLFAAPWLTFSVLMGSSIIATMIMEFNNGNNEVITPLTMVGLIVLASAIVLFGYLKKYE